MVFELHDIRHHKLGITNDFITGSLLLNLIIFYLTCLNLAQIPQNSQTPLTKTSIKQNHLNFSILFTFSHHPNTHFAPNLIFAPSSLFHKFVMIFLSIQYGLVESAIFCKLHSLWFSNPSSMSTSLVKMMLIPMGFKIKVQYELGHDSSTLQGSNQ